MDVTRHYDLLIDENNDPFNDPPVLQAYMDRWDGQPFIDLMALRQDNTVLEIGIGTGRLARKVAPALPAAHRDRHLPQNDRKSKGEPNSLSQCRSDLCRLPAASVHADL